MSGAAHGGNEELLGRDTPLHRLPPQCKVAALVLFAVAVALTPTHVVWPYALHLLVVLSAATVARVPPLDLARRLVIEIPFVLFVLMVGIWLGAHAPRRIERLVLCCTAAQLTPARAWHDRAAAVRAAGSTAPVADAVLSRWLTDGGRAADPGREQGLRRMLAATPAAGYAGCCEAIARMDLRPALARIEAPTLAIAGADDPATPPAMLRAIAAGIVGARVAVLDDAAHLANLERPRAFTDLVVEHCAGAVVEHA